MRIRIPLLKVPDQRTDGTPLAPSEISGIFFSVSTDNGQNWVPAGLIAANQDAFEIDITDIGTYMFKAEAIDTQNPQRDSDDSNIVAYTLKPPVLAAPNPPVLGNPEEE